ncbi:hypothetical protein TRFO_19678 [Tritrichomonas foetus]|uniref:Uncharacterized protein n=1 Tax=Tritrichomonas foetus TaxID=1144522 RepID=A0A1J4KNB5_9EUKA|nr:hypothetical protein TRFO_19678 [Tritrichomonas foetus]|eukprot:OHT10885.1 hypothetical protein TRFO_19678 [Tritrichomonas foetus]
MSKKEKLPILPMNYSAMRALLEENRRLREQLDQEKTTLSNDISSLQKHILLADKLSKANRISSELVEQFMLVSSSLDSLVLKPNITFHKAPSTQLNDLSDPLKQARLEYETLEMACREIAQKRTGLALDEQKLSTKRSTLLQTISASRQELNELMTQKEKLDHEIIELQSLKEFWEQKNDESKSVLHTAETEIGSFTSAQEAENVQKLQELYSIFNVLDDASQILREQI